MCCYVRERGGGKKNATYMSHICMKKESSAELKERGSLFVWLVGWWVGVGLLVTTALLLVLQGAGWEGGNSRAQE